ncbi:nuclear transport factor 2 family protein [Hyphococcus luteus]|uniref:SnoaL-like domain-containing protein n=1 Tax=Hyphococcus luteus TaxID=2058213 RepID=A0A2S7JZJ6_9PROT|nr:nuclear transport factor 2 family protein [Marinicaulis flavus]PQA85673.1 hypothetical protein CW354_22350 [Marinicaulis flavus]
MTKRFKGAFVALLAGASAVSMTAATSPAFARPPSLSEEHMLDRMQIEQMIIDYYAELGSGAHSKLSEYFTEDALFIVNGKRYKGSKAIDDIYAELGSQASEMRFGKSHMLMTNLSVQFEDEDTATARVIWTGVKNDNLKAPPRVFEQGREYDTLEKIDGVWYFSKRNIVSDSAMADQYDDTYMKDRPDH